MVGYSFFPFERKPKAAATPVKAAKVFTGGTDAHTKEVKLYYNGLLMNVAQGNKDSYPSCSKMSKPFVHWTLQMQYLKVQVTNL